LDDGLDPFDSQSNRIATAEAESCDASDFAVTLHGMEERHEHPSAAGADGMSEGDRAAVDVDLCEIEAELSTLSHGQAPTLAEWRAIGARMRGALAAKIAMLQRTHELLDGCIGCGCLSLDRCALYNPNDRAARAGPGPRFLLGNKASDFEND